ncbi:MAG: hypothetical protein JWO95_3530, partial [Verrucomicrobiales bacterium]|nr:hypothetical protein [Verrucomicrobiales bacterium]
MGGMNENITEDRNGADSCHDKLQITNDTEVQDAIGPSGHRRNGKVARLPKGVREQLNELLDDGVEYAEIIKTLGDAGKGLTKHNVSQWARGGYRDWIKEQERKV